MHRLILSKFTSPTFCIMRYMIGTGNRSALGAGVPPAFTVTHWQRKVHMAKSGETN